MILAAQWWGCPSPSYFHSLTKDDKIEILTAYEYSWKSKAINVYEAQQEAERKNK